MISGLFAEQIRERPVRNDANGIQAIAAHYTRRAKFRNEYSATAEAISLQTLPRVWQNRDTGNSDT